MSRGRPRKYNPAIPGHIDQLKIPKGAYWDARRHHWFTLVGKPQARIRLAGASATLTDLHTVLDELASPSHGRGTLAYIAERFTESATWAKLAPATQRDYNACQRLLERTRTTLGIPWSELQEAKLRRVHLQLLVDAIGKTRPAMANHVKRYLGRLFAWGMSRGECRDRANPAHGLDAATEKRQSKMPSKAVMWRTIQFAQARGARKPHTAGACPAYLWIVMLLAYRLRLRGVEAITLTDANLLPNGILSNRRKGSDDNITRWSPDLRNAVDTAVAQRNGIWARNRKPVPLQPSGRLLLVNESGEAITQGAQANTWRRFMTLAIADGVIASADRYTLHGLKHRGVTDTPGSKADKQRGSGHKDARMIDTYNHEVDIVDQAGGDNQ